MPKENYADKQTLTNTVNSNSGSVVVAESDGSDSKVGGNLTKNMLAKKMSGIEGLPYQFMSNVDRRITDTEMGRKYTEKIVSRLPLLFLTPCKQVFMGDSKDDNDKNVLINTILGNLGDDANDLINSGGRYYTVEYDYAEYYKYLNCMLAAVSAFLGIYDEKININGSSAKIGTYSWQNELNKAFKSYFSASENLIFYLDGLSSISESFTNDTTESSIAGTINGFSDTANEIKFLFGEKGGLLGNIIDSSTNAVSSISESLSGIIGTLGGGIVESIADKGVSTILNGGKIIFPEIWSNSSYDRSYSIDIKLRSPDNDSLSIFLNILKPYCRLLALVLPRLMSDADGKNVNPNGYRSPFLVKAYSKGLFNIDMGIITSMSVTKGAECCWNDDGLPTQIDISLDIKDLYSNLAMSGFGTSSNSKGLFKGLDGISSVVNNTAYMDYLANMAGLNIAQQELNRKLKMYYYLTQTDLNQIGSRLFTKFDENVSKLMGKLYQM